MTILISTFPAPGIEVRAKPFIFVLVKEDNLVRIRPMFGALALAATFFTIPAHAIEECTGGDRAARKLSCVVDGDTGWENGVKWRMLDLDAPETYGAECAKERQMGNAAKARLIELMDQGYTIEYSGEKDRTSDRRALVRVILADGRDAGAVLIAEGLAQGWPNTGNRWCGW